MLVPVLPRGVTACSTAGSSGTSRGRHLEGWHAHPSLRWGAGDGCALFLSGAQPGCPSRRPRTRALRTRGPRRTLHRTCRSKWSHRPSSGFVARRDELVDELVLPTRPDVGQNAWHARDRSTKSLSPPPVNSTPSSPAGRTKTGGSLPCATSATLSCSRRRSGGSENREGARGHDRHRTRTYVRGSSPYPEAVGHGLSWADVGSTGDEFHPSICCLHARIDRKHLCGRRRSRRRVAGEPAIRARRAAISRTDLPAAEFDRPRQGRVASPRAPLAWRHRAERKKGKSHSPHAHRSRRLARLPGALRGARSGRSRSPRPGSMRRRSCRCPTGRSCSRGGTRSTVDSPTDRSSASPGPAATAKPRPATAARRRRPTSAPLGFLTQFPDGSIVFGDGDGRRVRRVAPDGIHHHDRRQH